MEEVGVRFFYGVEVRVGALVDCTYGGDVSPGKMFRPELRSFDGVVVAGAEEIGGGRGGVHARGDGGWELCLGISAASFRIFRHNSAWGDPF